MCRTTHILDVNSSVSRSPGPQNAPKSLAAGASPQTPLGELTALPRPTSWVMGSTSKAATFKGTGRKKKEREERGGDAKMIYARAPEILAPPLPEFDASFWYEFLERLSWAEKLTKRFNYH